MAELTGLAAVVTGGGSGIGLATARLLASPLASSVTGTALAVDGGMAGLRLRPRA
jgi:NADP-dependent 3-hydroxy acid dehydrogenase YdfG